VLGGWAAHRSRRRTPFTRRNRVDGGEPRARCGRRIGAPTLLCGDIVATIAALNSRVELDQQIICSDNLTPTLEATSQIDECSVWTFIVSGHGKRLFAVAVCPGR